MLFESVDTLHERLESTLLSVELALLGRQLVLLSHHHVAQRRGLVYAH